MANLHQIPIAVTAALLSLPLATACGTEQPQVSSQAVSANAPRQTIELADSLLSRTVAEAGPVQGFWPFLADDAVFLEPGIDIVRGRDAIRAALAAAQAASPVRSLVMHRVAAGVSDDGRLAYTFGWYEQTAAGGAVSYWKYTAMWRNGGGHWRVEAFAKTAARKAPTPPPEGNPVIEGYHGVAIPGDPAALAADAAATDVAFSALAEAQSYCVAFPAFADDDAVVFGGNNFYYGIEWVRIAYSGCTPAEGASWGPVHWASTGSGDLAWTTGNATFSFDDGTDVTYSYSKYLTVWARQADGSWKWLLDSGSSRPAP